MSIQRRRSNSTRQDAPASGSDVLPFAVIGATGQQGGAVVDALLAAGHPVRALVRDQAAARSRELNERGVVLVRADLDDADSMVAGLGGVAALFMMTTHAGPAGPEGEVEHGRAIADAAVRAGVPRVVYSSVGGAERSTGVPHFESKRRVEEYLTAVIPASFVRPSFFMDNFTPALNGEGDEFVLRLPMPGSVLLQMIAVRDIGVIAGALLVDPSVIDGEAIEIAGDVLTGDQIAERIANHLGKAGRYEALPLDSLGENEDHRAMFRWFVETPAFAADLARTRVVDPTVLDLTTWLARH